MHINGVWEVPTMVDLAKKGKLFDWGAIQIPVFFDHACDLGGFALLRHPRPQGQPVDRREAQAVLDAIHWFNTHSLEWAGGGHVPAYLPVQESAEFKAMKPNSRLCRRSPRRRSSTRVSTLAGVASPVYDAAGNFIIPA